MDMRNLFQNTFKSQDKAFNQNALYLQNLDNIYYLSVSAPLGNSRFWALKFYMQNQLSKGLKSVVFV